MFVEDIMSGGQGDRLFSVILSESEIEVLQKAFADLGPTRYDRTDQLKGMKDSDILAEKKRSNMDTYGTAAKKAGLGAAIGGGLGAVAAGVLKAKGYKNISMKRAMGLGAGMGAAVGGSAGMIGTRQERADNNHYNNRLQYMQGQARRREMKDWNNNAVNREGYTY